MRNHKSEMEVVCSGFGALQNLACHDDIGIKIADHGGIDVILEAMRTHNHARVQVSGCDALFNIGYSRRDLQKKIKNAGVESVVKSAMSASSVTPGITNGSKDTWMQLLQKLSTW